MVRRLALGGIVLALMVATPALAQLPVAIPGGGTPDPLKPVTPRATEPIVMTGASFGSWAAPANQNAKLPLTDLAECPNPTNTDNCKHNHYATPEVETGDQLGQGTPVDHLLGYRWDATANGFVQIPFQVDEVFTRYLDNSASGFAIYSGEDKHTTYAYDREGWRYTDSDPNNVCHAIPFKEGNSRPKTTPDPVQGLDTNDELSFMASDAGPQAPSGSKAPAGIGAVQEVAINDPNNPSAAPTYVYVMKANDGGPKPAYDASNGYVSFTRDANSDSFEKSQSSYDNYGNAGTGQYCDANGNVVMKDGKPDIARRRPRDYASVQTPRYKFRYDGRWLMTALNISPDGGKTFGPDLVDRWKARAFQQDPSSNTPCCGFEEEDTHWGGSSTLLGERVGPVRAMRETWGADSGTNVIRRETFYRDSIVQKSWLRVHPIPPLDGIYAQWDFNAGAVTKYANRAHPEGVPVDGHNDEVFGNLDDPCNENYNVNDTGALAQQYRSFYSTAMLCDLSPYHQSIDVFDPTFSQANTALDWSVTSGPHGTVVDRYTHQARGPDSGRAGAVGGGRALLPRRLVLRRRHGHRPRSAREAGLERRAAQDGRGCRPQVLASRGRRTGRQRQVLPGRHRRARRAPSVHRRLRQRAADCADRRDRVGAGHGDAARRRRDRARPDRSHRPHGADRLDRRRRLCRAADRSLVQQRLGPPASDERRPGHHDPRRPRADREPASEGEQAPSPLLPALDGPRRGRLRASVLHAPGEEAGRALPDRQKPDEEARVCDAREPRRTLRVPRARRGRRREPRPLVAAASRLAPPLIRAGLPPATANGTA